MSLRKLWKSIRVLLKSRSEIFETRLTSSCLKSRILEKRINDFRNDYLTLQLLKEEQTMLRIPNVLKQWRRSSKSSTLRSKSKKTFMKRKRLRPNRRLIKREKGGSKRKSILSNELRMLMERKELYCLSLRRKSKSGWLRKIRSLQSHKSSKIQSISLKEKRKSMWGKMRLWRAPLRINMESQLQSLILDLLLLRINTFLQKAQGSAQRQTKQIEASLGFQAVALRAKRKICFPVE